MVTTIISIFLSALTEILSILPLPLGSIYTSDWSTKAQFEVKTICAMIKNIRTILTPLLIMSYVFGLRIAKSNHSRLWFSVTYILLVWSVYYFLVLYVFISFYKYLSFMEKIGHCLETSVTILSIVFGIYYDKVTNCLNICNIINKKQLL